MKHIIYIFIILFLGSHVQANSDYTGEIKCLKDVSAQLDPARFHLLEYRNTILYTLVDGKNPGRYSNEDNEGFFQIENNKVQFCGLPWDREKSISFAIHDSAGRAAFTYTRTAPNFRPLGGISGLMANSRRCKDVSGSTRTNEMLKKIIIKAMEAQASASGVAKYKPPQSCLSLKNVSIAQFDIQKLKSSKVSEPPSEINK
jgi:hypothetical protein